MGDQNRIYILWQNVEHHSFHCAILSLQFSKQWYNTFKIFSCIQYGTLFKEESAYMLNLWERIHAKIFSDYTSEGSYILHMSRVQ